MKHEYKHKRLQIYGDFPPHITGGRRGDIKGKLRLLCIYFKICKEKLLTRIQNT